MYDLKSIIASTCMCSVDELNIQLDNDFESMEIFEDLIISQPVNKPVKPKEEELSDDDFFDF